MQLIPVYASSTFPLRVYTGWAKLFDRPELFPFFFLIEKYLVDKSRGDVVIRISLLPVTNNITRRV